MIFSCLTFIIICYIRTFWFCFYINFYYCWSNCYISLSSGCCYFIFSCNCSNKISLWSKFHFCITSSSNDFKRSTYWYIINSSNFILVFKRCIICQNIYFNWIIHFCFYFIIFKCCLNSFSINTDFSLSFWFIIISSNIIVSYKSSSFCISSHT